VLISDPVSIKRVNSIWISTDLRQSMRLAAVILIGLDSDVSLRFLQFEYVQGDWGQPPKDLDLCSGHTDKTHPYYHYHTTSNFPYVVSRQVFPASRSTHPTTGCF
jgi:hypothetical protein